MTGGVAVSALLSGPAAINLLIAAGLFLNCLGCLWLLARQRRDGMPWGRLGHPAARGLAIVRRHIYLVPSLLILSGFVLSWSSSTAWFVAVAVLVLGMGWYATHVAGRGHRLADSSRAVIASATVLTLLGSLVTVRIVVARDPGKPFGGGFASGAIGDGASAILVPLAIALAVLAFWHLATLRGVTPRRLMSGRAVPLVLFGLAVGLFILPRLVPGGKVGDASLTVYRVATPEYAKIFFVLFLGVIVARNFERYDGTSLRELLRDVRAAMRPGGAGDRRALLLKTRHLLYPMAFFCFVAGLSGLRHDFGGIVPTLAATVAVTWIATRRSAGHTASGEGLALTRTLKDYRLFLATFVILCGAAAIVTLTSTNYISERAKVWSDPWAYRWDSSCMAPPVTPSDPPKGVNLCQISMAADVEGSRSQVAKALSAIADGGIFGRGLDDTASAVVPAGPTDFILAVMWNKLGGITVLLTTLLMLLLGAAILQATRRADGEPTIGSLFGAGFAGLVVGQYLFVFAATLNVIPHSGIPAPLISRSGQANLAILIGVVLVLALARAETDEDADSLLDSRAPGRKWWDSLARKRFGTAVAFGLCLLVAAEVTINPYTAPFPGHSLRPTVYRADRPICAARRASEKDLLSPPRDPRQCSTDRLAYSRTRVELRFNGSEPLRLNRETGEWEQPEAGSMTLADLSGLIRVGDGEIGVVERSFPEIVDSTAGTRLAWRLSPPGGQRPADGVLDLTIEPRLQHLIAEALRSPGPDGANPLAGGMVVIEARTGRILAAASVPVDDPVFGPAPDLRAGEAYVRGHPNYGRADPAGGLDGSLRDPTCAAEPAGSCWRWSYRAEAQIDVAASNADRRRYVGAGTPEKDLPQANVNRAMGKQYGVGSTFKVITAAAYLRNGGDPGSLLDAPTSITLAPKVIIRNSGGGACPGTVAGRISLTQALAVSCNTAFVGLAQKVGWQRIAAQAERFGFHIGRCDESVPAWSQPRLTGAVGSCVPATTDAVAIGNNALGGQDVSGTPLQLATMMAAIANRGAIVKPTLVRGMTYPDTGVTTTVQPGQSAEALPASVNSELVEALAQTAKTGTMRGLADTLGRKLWVKTGTNDIVPPGSFVRVNSWLAGFIDTDRGPVAFAVVQEAPDGNTGAARNRHLVTLLGKALVAP